MPYGNPPPFTRAANPSGLPYGNPPPFTRAANPSGLPYGNPPPFTRAANPFGLPYGNPPPFTREAECGLKSHAPLYVNSAQLHEIPPACLNEAHLLFMGGTSARKVNSKK